VTAMKIVREYEVFDEATQILMEHMSPAKVVRFWSEVFMGGGDYASLREKMFEGETADSLFEKVKEFEGAD